MRPRVLPGLPASRSGIIGTIAILLAVLLSRLLLLPDGPWEQDEALFAAGVLDFDVTRHRPQPPGFPGWIAIGKLGHPLLGDPLLALQVASSVASVGLLWCLAHLLDRITPGGRATLAALAFCASPLAWVHAGRAFSTTPALALAAGAVLLWSQGPRAHSIGWALLGLAAAVRPQLGPELVVLSAAGIVADVPRRAKVLGLLAVLVVFGLASAATVLGAPDPSAVRDAFADHFGRHQGGLGRSLRWSELGFVRGLVHPLIAASLAAATLVGLGLAVRADLRRGGWLLALVVVTAWMILRQHHPGFPRYAVALLAACLPAIAWTMSALRRRPAFILLGLATVVGTAASVGTLIWMRAAPLPVVAAGRLAASDPDASALAYSHGVFSFARLQAERAGLRSIDVSEPSTAPSLPRHAYAIEGRTLRALSGVTTCAIEMGPAPPQAMVLGQGRFHDARVLRDPVLLGEGVHTPERDDVGDRFAWADVRSSLHLPAGSQRLQLRVDVPDDVAGAGLLLRRGARSERHQLRGGPMAFAFDVPACADGCSVALAVDRIHDAQHDPRTLTVRLEAAWAEGPGYVPAYAAFSPGHPRTLRAHDVVLEGFEEPERFARGRRGAWTQAEARLSFPALPGTVRMELARPDHVPGDVVLASDAQTRTMAIGPAITTVVLRTEAPNGRAQLRVSSPTFVPMQVREGTTDTRSLGLIVYGISFVPDADPCRPTAHR